ncbi:MAG TPA: aspartyl protease family protein, partial [Blastocatellia bacterium]|nr:aspartyl protease family protein [Blastocatellia bacterium]
NRTRRNSSVGAETMALLGLRKGGRRTANAGHCVVLCTGLILSAAVLAPVASGGALGAHASSLPSAAADSSHKKSGERLMRQGLYEKALNVFLEDLKSNIEDVRAQIGAAAASLKLQKYDECYEHARVVLKQDPNNARAHSLLGVALLRSGYIPAAIAELEEAIRINPKDALAWGGLSEIDYYTNRTKEARQRSYYAYVLDPNEPDYLVTYARSSSRLEMFNEAADAYERYLEVAPRTDVERRARIQGLIDFYRKLTGIHLHQLSGPKSFTVDFVLGPDRRPYIKMRLNGHDANFVIDTGSGFTVISDVAAKKFGVTPVARGGTSQGVGGSGKFAIVYGLIDSMNLGDEKIDSVPCFIRPFHEDHNRASNYKADGFIGLSVLSNFLTQIDYEKSRMYCNRDNPVAANLSPMAPGVTVIPFRITENGLISVETQLDDTHMINAIVDTGASSTVVSTAAVKRLDMSKSIIAGAFVQVVGAAGVSDNVPLLHIRHCRVADLQQKDLRALIMDFGAINETTGFEQSGIIGGDFLQHFRLTIDFNRGTLVLEPETAAITRLDSVQRLNSRNGGGAAEDEPLLPLQALKRAAAMTPP